MLCRNPYVKGRQSFGCGQCLPCLFNRRRVWTHRIVLEAAQHADNTMLTLTYADESLTFVEDAGDRLATLVPKDLQDWLKRFRKAIEPTRVRFFAVGEYGDESWRPHYHAIVFGYPTCRYGRSQFSVSRRGCCAACDLVRDTWGKGLVQLDACTTNSIQYVCGYVTKKMTSARNDTGALRGRHPEFARMSRDGGIGVSAMHEVASQLMRFNLDQTQSDVPVALRHGGRTLPLGRTLRRKLRAMVNMEENAPPATMEKAFDEVRALYEDAVNAASPLKFQKSALQDLIFKNNLIDAGSQKVAQQTARRKIFKSKRSI